jgi:C4-dicarboxylate-specific signal transduction histidine kinase
MRLKVGKERECTSCKKERIIAIKMLDVMLCYQMTLDEMLSIRMLVEGEVEVEEEEEEEVERRRRRLKRREKGRISGS